MILLVLLFALPMVALFALSRHRALTGIIAMGVLSFLLAAVYALQGAPDVAVAEAAIGAALVTLIYVLAVRRTGRLVIVAADVPTLFHRQGNELVGLEYDLLARFAEEEHLELMVHFVSPQEVADAVKNGNAEVGAGGMVSFDRKGCLTTQEHLETALFAVGGQDQEAPPPWIDAELEQLAGSLRKGKRVCVTLDLARFLALGGDVIGTDRVQVRRLPELHSYQFLIAQDCQELQVKLNRYLERLRNSGELDTLIQRHLR
ncbi:DUF4040 domain-containing protein [Candidatus Bipolaricaulota bacterium]|nr:DUF4040 domain-containing protein [Candidatus Bipolaricaulota bacterium]